MSVSTERGQMPLLFSLFLIYPTLHVHSFFTISVYKTEPIFSSLVLCLVTPTRDVCLLRHVSQPSWVAGPQPREEEQNKQKRSVTGGEWHKHVVSHCTAALKRTVFRGLLVWIMAQFLLTLKSPHHTFQSTTPSLVMLARSTHPIRGISPSLESTAR